MLKSTHENDVPGGVHLERPRPVFLRRDVCRSGEILNMQKSNDRDTFTSLVSVMYVCVSGLHSSEYVIIQASQLGVHVQVYEVYIGMYIHMCQVYTPYELNVNG